MAEQSSCRQFIKAGEIFIAASGLTANVLAQEKGKEEEVSPPEDLMREHGVLKRILLIYGEALQRIDSRSARNRPELVRLRFDSFSFSASRTFSRT